LTGLLLKRGSIEISENYRKWGIC